MATAVINDTKTVPKPITITQIARLYPPARTHARTHSRMCKVSEWECVCACVYLSHTRSRARSLFLCLSFSLSLILSHARTLSLARALSLALFHLCLACRHVLPKMGCWYIVAITRRRHCHYHQPLCVCVCVCV